MFLNLWRWNRAPIDNMWRGCVKLFDSDLRADGLRKLCSGCEK